MSREDQLKSIVSLLGSSATKTEVLDSYKQVLKVVSDHKQMNEREWTLIRSAFQMLEQKLHESVANGLGDIKGQVNHVFVKDKLTQIEKDLHAKVDAKIATVKDGKSIKGDPGRPGKPGKDGRDANESAIHDRVLRSIKPILEKQSSDLTDKIPKQVQTPAKVYRTHTADLSSQCDGNTTTFNVGGVHFGIVGVYSTEFPQIYRPIIDYTETKNGFTLTSQVSAPAAGQTLVALFLK